MNYKDYKLMIGILLDCDIKKVDNIVELVRIAHSLNLKTANVLLGIKDLKHKSYEEIVTKIMQDCINAVVVDIDLHSYKIPNTLLGKFKPIIIGDERPKFGIRALDILWGEIYINPDKVRMDILKEMGEWKE